MVKIEIERQETERIIHATFIENEFKNYWKKFKLATSKICIYNECNSSNEFYFLECL